MAKTKAEIGQEFLEEVITKLPADQQAVARQAFANAGGVIDLVGERVMLRSDYSSQSDALREQQEEILRQKQALDTWREQLRTWAATKEQELAARVKDPIKPAASDPPPTKDPMKDPTAITGVSKDEVFALAETLGKNTVSFVTELFQLQADHARMFPGDTFDPAVLLSHPHVKEVGLRGAYTDVFKEKLTAKATADAAAKEAQIRQDERQKVLAEVGTTKVMPFPIPGGDTSPLAVLEGGKTQPDDYSQDAVLAFARQLRSEQVAS